VKRKFSMVGSANNAGWSTSWRGDYLSCSLPVILLPHTAAPQESIYVRYGYHWRAELDTDLTFSGLVDLVYTVTWVHRSG
jgi:hypothetical protein